MSIDVPVKTWEISAREILSCYAEQNQRCRNSMELRASREHRGSNEGAPRETSQGLEG